MSMINSKDSAFPICQWVGDRHDGHTLGMTKREWFAGQVLPGLLRVESIMKTEIAAGDPYSALAKMAYKFADAMLEEGSKK